MYPSFNDFDPDYYSDEFEPEDDYDTPETDVIAGIEIRGSEPEDEWDGEQMPF